MEVGYVDLGTVDYSAPTGTRETHGVTMQLLGTYALNPSFTLLARGGMNFLKTDVSGAVAGASGNAEDTDVVWSLGLGAQYNFTQSVGSAWNGSATLKRGVRPLMAAQVKPTLT